MQEAMDSVAQETGPLAGSRVFIAGPRHFQNLLIAYFLERQGGAACACGGRPQEALGPNPPQMVLWDVHQLPLATVLEVAAQPELRTRVHLALFNVVWGEGLEERTIKLGVRGFFYTGESPEGFLKGVSAISRGDVWVPRKVMERCLLRPRPALPRPGESDQRLTRREAEILFQISRGASNAEIAQALFISPHTVKTHIYNMFKKISVSNRMQAARWAAENLAGLLEPGQAASGLRQG